MANPNCWFLDEPFRTQRKLFQQQPLASRVDVLLNMSQCCFGGVKDMMDRAVGPGSFRHFARQALYDPRNFIGSGKAGSGRLRKNAKDDDLAAALYERCSASRAVCVKSISLKGQLRVLDTAARERGVRFQGLQLIRDPRLVLDSQASLKFGGTNNTLESRLQRICTDAESDTRAALEAQALARSNLQHICYEDIVTDPLGVTQRVYRSLGPGAASALHADRTLRSQVPSEVWAFGEKHMAAWPGSRKLEGAPTAPRGRGEHATNATTAGSPYGTRANTSEDAAKQKSHTHSGEDEDEEDEGELKGAPTAPRGRGKAPTAPRGRGKHAKDATTTESPYGIRAKTLEDIAKQKSHTHSKEEYDEINRLFDLYCRPLRSLVRCGSGTWPATLDSHRTTGGTSGKLI